VVPQERAATNCCSFNYGGYKIMQKSCISLVFGNKSYKTVTKIFAKGL